MVVGVSGLMFFFPHKALPGKILQGRVPHSDLPFLCTASVQLAIQAPLPACWPLEPLSQG